MAERDEFGAFLVGFVVGTLTGAVTALLLAPQTGEETRGVIRDKAYELKTKAGSTVEDAPHRRHGDVGHDGSEHEHVDHHGHPERAAETLLGRLVPEHQLSDDRAGPAADQAEQQQGRFWHPPSSRLRTCLVVAVHGEGDDARDNVDPHELDRYGVDHGDDTQHSDKSQHDHHAARARALRLRAQPSGPVHVEGLGSTVPVVIP